MRSGLMRDLRKLCQNCSSAKPRASALRPDVQRVARAPFLPLKCEKDPFHEGMGPFTEVWA